jgi:hypothetical protein
MGAELSYQNDFGESYMPHYYGQEPSSYDQFGNTIYYQCESAISQLTVHDIGYEGEIFVY